MSSLYDKLKKIKEGYDGAFDRYDSLCTLIHKSKDLLGQQKIELRSPNEDIKGIASAINDHILNPILHDAKLGYQSIEDKLCELSKINKGIRGILPRRKNEERNKQVEHMEELLGYNLDGLKSLGVFRDDNIFSAAALNTVISEAVLLGMMYTLSLTDPESSIPSGGCVFMAKYGAPFLSLLFTGVTRGKGTMFGSGAERIYKLPYDRARFLDEMIRKI